jgi:hypothetical protein
MKVKITFCLVFFTHLIYSQFKVSNGTTVTVANDEIVYVNEPLVNEGNITLNSSRLLLGNNFNNASGTLNSADATIELVGENSQSLTFANNDVVKRFELNKSSNTATVLAGKLSITDVLQSLSGTLDAGEKVVLVSTNSKTAIVAPSSGGTIDNIVVERFIPAKRAYRLLSSPVTSSTSIRYNWQEDQNNTSQLYSNNSNTKLGFGTHISGSTTGANGFDATQSGNASLFTFDNTAQNWSPIANTNIVTLNAGAPYRLMVRGDRSIDLNTNTPTATNTVLRTTGSLRIGPHVDSSLSTVENEFNFIGNPYQSPIDIEAILNNSSNVNTNHYYVWDPKVGGTNGRGAYVTYTFVNNSNNVSGSLVNEFVQPMQSFFVKTLANGAASIQFNENNKHTITNENVYRSNVVSTLKLNVFDTASLLAGETPLDGVMCMFDSDFSNDVDDFDAEKFTNLDENLSVQIQNNALSIASFADPVITTEYALKLSNFKHQSYSFKAELLNYQGLTPYLFDNFNNTYTTIENGMIYDFTVDQNQPLTTSPTRFKIVFTNTTLSIDNPNLDSFVHLYPNPSQAGIFNLSLPASLGEVTVELYNELGQKIAINPVKISNNQIQYKTNHVVSYGIYHVVIIPENGNVIVKKWVVNN